MLNRFFSSSARRLFADPKSASFSPLAAQKTQYKSPYATSYPTASAIPKEASVKRPYERLISVRKIVRVSAKGKHMKFDAWCLVGDRNGSASVANVRSSQPYKAIQAALVKARSSMKHYDLDEGRTLFHKIDLQYHSLKLRIVPKPPGYSVRAQRDIYEICQALGIQDLAVKIMGGTTNPITITRAFFHALENKHKTPEQVSKARGMTVDQVANI